MLVIRMQRTGRSGHAQFRVVVQDSRRTPTSGKIVASLGHFDPHSKQTSVDKEKAAFYLEHGAQPSERVARLLKAEGVKLPKWVELEGKKKRAIRNPEKLRRNRPTEPKPEKAATAETEEVAPEPAVEEVATEAPDEEQAEVEAETSTEAVAESETPAEEATAEAAPKGNEAEPAPAEETPEEESEELAADATPEPKK